MSLVKVGSFASRVEAGIAAGVLQSHGIWHTIRSDDIGIFGPGHMGRSAIGADLMVAGEDLEEARRLLEEAGFISP